MFSNGRYANVTATMALIVALGGTSYAAIKLPANSVGSTQLKKHAVTEQQAARERRDLRDGEERIAPCQGLQGRPAPGRPAGPAGPAGATNIVSRRMPSLPVAAGAIGAVKMTCLPGERAVIGGLQSDADPLNIFAVTESFPVTTGDVPTGWYVEVRNTASSSDQFLGFLVCAKP